MMFPASSLARSTALYRKYCANAHINAKEGTDVDKVRDGWTENG